MRSIGSMFDGERMGRATVLVAVAIGSACTDSAPVERVTPPGPAAVVERVSPDSVSVQAGDTMPVRLAVRVRDARGTPVPGVTVIWQTSSTISPSRVDTDALGEAQAVWHPTIYMAFPDIAVATVITLVGEQRVVFRAAGRVGPVVGAAVQRADTLPRATGIVVEVGERVRFVAVGRDAQQNVIVDPPVTWSSANPARATVDANGVLTGLAQGAVRINAAIATPKTVPSAPVLVVDPLRARGVAVGAKWSCARSVTDQAVCWGDPFTLSYLPTDSVVEPRVLSSTLRFSTLRASETTVCGIASNGAYCWLGPARAGAPSGAPLAPAPVFVGRTLQTVVPGTSHACGLDPAGSVLCLMLPDRIVLPGDPEIVIRIDTPVLHALTASGVRSCGAAADGVYCWDAQLTGGFSAPERVPGTAAMLDVGLSGQQLCTLDASGTVRCVDAVQGTIGTAWKVQLTGIASGLAVGPFTVCGITTDARLRCTGSNVAGLMMRRADETTPALLDAPAPDGTGWSAMALSDWGAAISASLRPDPHACAITLAGRTYCWGAATYGQLGVPNEMYCTLLLYVLPCSPTPLPVPSPRAAIVRVPS